MLLVFSHFYGFGKNMVVERRALVGGLYLCLTKGFLKVTIETDSMALFNVVQMGDCGLGR